MGPTMVPKDVTLLGTDNFPSQPAILVDDFPCSLDVSSTTTPRPLWSSGL